MWSAPSHVLVLLVTLGLTAAEKKPNIVVILADDLVSRL